MINRSGLKRVIKCLKAERKIIVCSPLRHWKTLVKYFTVTTTCWWSTKNRTLLLVLMKRIPTLMIERAESLCRNSNFNRENHEIKLISSDGRLAHMVFGISNRRCCLRRNFLTSRSLSSSRLKLAEPNYNQNNRFINLKWPIFLIKTRGQPAGSIETTTGRVWTNTHPTSTETTRTKRSRKSVSSYEKTSSMVVQVNGKKLADDTHLCIIWPFSPFRIRHFDRKRTFEQFKKRMEKGFDPMTSDEKKGKWEF